MRCGLEARKEMPLCYKYGIGMIAQTNHEQIAQRQEFGKMVSREPTFLACRYSLCHTMPYADKSSQYTLSTLCLTPSAYELIQSIYTLWVCNLFIDFISLLTTHYHPLMLKLTRQYNY